MALLIATLALPSRPDASEWHVLPSVRWRESYSDNINLASGPLAHSDLASELTPAIDVQASGPRFRANLAYSLQLTTFQHSTATRNRNLSAALQATPLHDWLELDVHSSIARHSRSPFGPQRSDPSNQDANTTEVRTHRINPVIAHRFAGWGSFRLSLSRQALEADALHTSSTDAALTLASDRSAPWGWSAQASRRRLDDRGAAPVILTDGSATLRHVPSGRMALSLTLGSEQQRYRPLRGDPQGRYWSAGVAWAPTARTSVTASMGHRYFGKTYGLDASHRAHRSIWRLAYSEDITTSHYQALDVQPAQAAAVLEQLWRPAIPDPVQRQRDIEALIQGAQLLAPPANRFNYFSHAYYLQKQAVASLAMAGNRHTVLLSASVSRRRAQSSSVLDNILLPPTESNLLEQTRQRGADAVWTMRASSTTQFNVAHSASRIESISGRRTDSNRVWRAGMAHQFQRQVDGALDLRRVRHVSSAGSGYTENGISAMLNVRF